MKRVRDARLKILGMTGKMQGVENDRKN